MPFRPEIPNHTNDTSSYLDSPASLSEQFIVEEKRNPELVRQVSEIAWDKLGPDQQDNITVLAAHLFPDDMESRQRAIRLHLITEHFAFLTEQATSGLESSYEAPTVPHPHNDYIA